MKERSRVEQHMRKRRINGDVHSLRYVHLKFIRFFCSEHFCIPFSFILRTFVFAFFNWYFLVFIWSCRIIMSFHWPMVNLKLIFSYQLTNPHCLNDIIRDFCSANIKSCILCIKSTSNHFSIERFQQNFQLIVYFWII